MTRLGRAAGGWARTVAASQHTRRPARRTTPGAGTLSMTSARLVMRLSFAHGFVAAAHRNEQGPGGEDGGRAECAAQIVRRPGGPDPWRGGVARQHGLGEHQV